MNGSKHERIERFHAAFAARDGAGMAACHAPDATFDDPVFPGLRGREVGGMRSHARAGLERFMAAEDRRTA